MLTLNVEEAHLRCVKLRYETVGKPCFVAGGFVRDILLGIQPRDIDIFVAPGIRRTLKDLPAFIDVKETPLSANDLIQTFRPTISRVAWDEHLILDPAFVATACTREILFDLDVADYWGDGRYEEKIRAKFNDEFSFTRQHTNREQKTREPFSGHYYGS